MKIKENITNVDYENLKRKYEILKWKYINLQTKYYNLIDSIDKDFWNEYEDLCSQLPKW